MSLRDLWHLRPVAKFRHSYVILICSADFADRQWACPSKGTGNPLHFWRSSKLGQLCYVSFFQLSNFCLNCQKRWNFAGTRCNFDKWSPIKLFRLPKITKQLLTFKTVRLQASIFAVLTDCITTTTPHAHNPSASLGQKDIIHLEATLSHKLYVLCHKSLKDISPRTSFHMKRL